MADPVDASKERPVLPGRKTLEPDVFLWFRTRCMVSKLLRSRYNNATI